MGYIPLTVQYLETQERLDNKLQRRANEERNATLFFRVNENDGYKYNLSKTNNNYLKARNDVYTITSAQHPCPDHLCAIVVPTKTYATNNRFDPWG